MSVKKKYDTIDRILKKFNDLQWSESRCAYYLGEFKEVGHTGNGYDGYDLEYGLKNATFPVLEKIEKDLEIEGLDSRSPAIWSDRDELLNNTRYIRVFISHLDENRKTAQSLAKALEPFHIKCFVAHADIKPPSNWSSEIKKALRTMECLVSLNIKEFPNQKTLKESAWCMQEIGAAIVRDVPIVNVCTQDQKQDVENGKLGFLSSIQYLNLLKSNEVGCKENNKKFMIEAIQHDIRIKTRMLEINNLIEKEKEEKNRKDFGLNDDIPF